MKHKKYKCTTKLNIVRRNVFESISGVILFMNRVKFSCLSMRFCQYIVTVIYLTIDTNLPIRCKYLMMYKAAKNGGKKNCRRFGCLQFPLDVAVFRRTAFLLDIGRLTKIFCDMALSSVQV